MGKSFQVFQPHGVQRWEALGSLALFGLSSFQDCFHPLSSSLLICYSLCLKQAFWWGSQKGCGGLVITVCFRNEMDCCCISRSWLVHRPSFYISCKGCRYNVDRMEIWEIQFPLVSIRNWQSACLDSPIEWISPWKKLSSPVS